jgi:hypothetical protein
LFFSGGLFTTDYLTDAISHTSEWIAIDAPALRARLTAIIAGFPRSAHPNESQTETDLIWPALRELGWGYSLQQQNLTVTGRDDVPDGLLFPDAQAKERANSERDEWRRYSHGVAIVESKRWGRTLDRAGRGEEAATPSTQMLRYLRRIDDLTNGRLRWGILTNGSRWRLYWAGARSVSEQFLEIDLTRVLGLDPDLLDAGVTDAERDHWLRVFAAIFSRDAFIPTGTDGLTFHARALRQSAFYEERVAKDLSAIVFNRVFPDIAAAIARAAPNASLHEVRDASLILLYRLLFLLYAEDRDLLPVRDNRYDDYALRPLRLQVGERVSEGDAFSASASAIWSRIADLSRMVDKGDKLVGLPPYNGGLFAADQTALLETIRIPDTTMAMALDALSFERSTGTRRYINYRDLSVQQLGSIYERLLEYELSPEGEGLRVALNPFARRNTGSYYTPDELVSFILDETLKPLVAERLTAFRDTLVTLKRGDAEDYRRRTLKAVDPAEAILSLRVCDPAMGSGHFLVSLVDKLTDNVLDAMAEAASLAIDLQYTSPLTDKIESIRDIIHANAVRNEWSIDEAQLDDRHIVRRMVLKRCVYGVDKNPMAVELAKVALWLHTFTVGAPLSFIDHHLRTGDSLFGLWVRDAIDRASAKGGELLHAEPLRRASSAAAAMRAIEDLTDAQIAEAHRSAEMYDGIGLMTAPLDAFVSVMHALDWLNLRTPEDRAAVRAWLDGQFGDPIGIMDGRIEPRATKSSFQNDGSERLKGQAFNTADLFERAKKVIADARALAREEHFLNWQVSFPGVWQNWSSGERTGGFDAVVGNPPWDRMKLQQVEWFAARRSEIALAQRASDRKRLINRLKSESNPLWTDFSRAEERAAAAARVARSSRDYPLLSGGDTNLNSLFVERAHSLLKPNGMVGLLIPSGIASDQSSAGFFRKMAEGHQVHCIIDFFNRRYDGTLFFPDVYYRFKFCAYVAGGAQRTFDSASFGFFIRDVAEINDSDRVFPMSVEEIKRINPNSRTAPIFRSLRDKALTSEIYRKLPVLVDRSSGRAKPLWPVHYATMFHMANDSALFRTASELADEEGAWPVGGNHFQSAQGEWVPLYEGKMVQMFDHRASDIVLAEANVYRPGQGSDLTDEDHRDPSRQPIPRYWVLASTVHWHAPTDWCLALKDVTSVTNTRTVITAIIPRAGAGHTLPVFFPIHQNETDQVDYRQSALLLLANFNSVVLDYVARQKVHGNHLAWYLIEQLPLIPLEGYGRMFGQKSARDIVREAVLELTYTSHDMVGFATDLGYVDIDGEPLPPFIWDEERRMALRAKLDALYFILYGVFDPARPTESREDVRYIFSTFPQWTDRDRSRDLTLSWVNALLAGRPDADVSG